jgi:uncharacterized protein (TIGR00725 family)
MTLVPTTDLLRQLAARQLSERRLLQPVALIGPRQATLTQVDVAYRIALALASAGMALVCGGKIGVMEAAARGARDAKGVCIGLLPEEDASFGSPYLTVALPTGMGLSRNMLVARAGVCLVAVGAGLGTLSEMAMGLQWNKPVFAMFDSPSVPGAQRFDSEDQLLNAVVQWLLAHEPKATITDLGG